MTKKKVKKVCQLNFRTVFSLWTAPCFIFNFRNRLLENLSIWFGGSTNDSHFKKEGCSTFRCFCQRSSGKGKIYLTRFPLLCWTMIILFSKVASLCKPESIPNDFMSVLQIYTKQGLRVIAGNLILKRFFNPALNPI